MTATEQDLRTKGYAVGPRGLARLEELSKHEWIVTATPVDGEGQANILRDRESAVKWALGIVGEKP